MPGAAADLRATPLHRGWQVAMTAPDAPPPAAGASAWRPARVPGLAQADLGVTADTLDEHDVWYRCDFASAGPARLRLNGLAGAAGIRLDGLAVADVRSMFLAHDIAVDAGEHDLLICFPALAPQLAAAKGPRARWRPTMMTAQALRLLRLAPLGHMTGWAPRIAQCGVYRPVELLPQATPGLVDLRLIPALEGRTGRLTVDARFDAPVRAATLSCAGTTATLTALAPDRWTGELLLPEIAPWWPHSHGTPALHAVTLTADDRAFDLNPVGFRHLELDRGPDGQGFALRINGERIFCRGANWTPPDPFRPGSADPQPLLARAVDAGMTMLRLSGATLPESDAFHRACDEAGVLVWQDLPLANFDYPFADADFTALVTAETVQLLTRLQASPSLAVVCGGSEIAQQAMMQGLKPDQARIDFCETTLPALVAAHAPQAMAVAHSPFGGVLPFSTNQGVTHYYGVGAYRRPLSDARLADVRFASECLAFANVPSPARLRASGLTDPASPRWAAGVPRDLGADWDFETVRDHYVATLYGVDAAALRAQDPARYLALGRAAPAELMEAVFAEWRRAGSRCAGGLVWTLNDMAPGAGWGVIDDRGEPKTTWHALRRAFRPLHLGLTDEGLNGLGLHCVNETAQPRQLRLTLASYGEGPHPLARAERALALAPREAVSFASAELFGRFFDVTDAYRFGPCAHDATLARLFDAASGALLAEASHVLPGRACQPRDIGLAARLADDHGAPALQIETRGFARFVTIDDDDFRAADEGFCLAPGESRLVRLHAHRAGARPSGAVGALNSFPVRYGEARP
jgi:beta-mannosidase